MNTIHLLNANCTAQAPLSHCKHEFRVGDSKSVSKLAKQPESPTLVVMSVHMHTVHPTPELLQKFRRSSRSGVFSTVT